MRNFVCLFFLAACGPRLPLTLGSNSSTPPAELSLIRVRFVHLYSPGDGTPGGAVDIYRKWSTTTSIGEESTPVVSGLAYGSVSEFVHPLDDSQAFVFYNAGTKERALPYQGFLLSERFADGENVTVNIVQGTKAGATTFPAAWNTRTESPATAASFPPSANASKARVVVYDIGFQQYSSPGYFVGSGGTCLNAVGDTGTPSLLVTDKRVFDFDAGAISVGLFLNGGGAADCSGAASIGPASFSATAGSRTWVYLYGPSATDLRTLVLPFGD